MARRTMRITVVPYTSTVAGIRATKYRVVKAVNTLEPGIGATLTKSEVYAEINDGIEVTITEAK